MSFRVELLILIKLNDFLDNIGLYTEKAVKAKPTK